MDIACKKAGQVVEALIADYQLNRGVIQLVGGGGSAAVLAYNMASSMLRALGDGGTPLAAILIASAVNIGLDLLFVLVFQWGIFGAALATVLAQVLAFLFCLRALRKMDILKPEREDWRWDKSAAARLCRCSLPTALQNALIALGGMTVQFVLNGFGMLFVAGFTATNKLLGLLESTAVAFGQGMNTYMGQNRGAGNIRRIDEGMRSVLLLSLELLPGFIGMLLGIIAANVPVALLVMFLCRNVLQYTEINGR